MASHRHNTQQQVAIGIVSGLFALATIVVCLRMYLRCILLKAGPPGWDDLTVFVAWIMAMAASIATYIEIESGSGRHVEELSTDQLHNLNLSFFVGLQFYTVGLNFVKLSFLAQFHRVIPDRTIRRICVCFAFFCSMWMIVQSILYSFSCVPIQSLAPAMSTVCINTPGIWTATSVVNLITDAVILYIPLKPLWRTPLLKRQRYFLMGIFGFGILVCVISIIRIPILHHAGSSPNPTYTNVSTSLWSLAELESAIICTSLPALIPIIARFTSSESQSDAGPNQTGARSRRLGSKSGKAKDPHFSPPNTTLSGSTLATRSFFRGLTTRDEDEEVEERPVVSNLLGMNNVAGINYRDADNEKALNTSIDFFYLPNLEKATQEPHPFLPPGLCKDTSKEPCRKKSSIPAQPISPQDSVQQLLRTPISPTSTNSSGNDTTGQASERTTSSSFSRSRQTPGDDFYSQDMFSRTGNTSSEACTREVCSRCSSELLPERLRSPALVPPDDGGRAAQAQAQAQAQDAGSQTTTTTIASWRRRATSPAVVGVHASNAMVTQSTQTAAVPWEASPASSRPSSGGGEWSVDRVDAVAAVRRGTIARARERAMQAVADKTFGQVGEVHQGRARVVQVDTSQRRKAAIGLDEVLGLDVDQSPWRFLGLIQDPGEAVQARDGNLDSPKAAAAAAGKELALAEPELTRDDHQEGGGLGCDARSIGKKRITSTNLSTSQVSEFGDQDIQSPSAAGRRAAGTSWLRLSTDMSP